MRNALKIYLNLFHFSSNELRSLRSGMNMAKVQPQSRNGQRLSARGRGRQSEPGANGAATQRVRNKLDCASLMYTYIHIYIYLYMYVCVSLISLTSRFAFVSDSHLAFVAFVAAF